LRAHDLGGHVAQGRALRCHQRPVVRSNTAGADVLTPGPQRAKTRESVTGGSAMYSDRRVCSTIRWECPKCVALAAPRPAGGCAGRRGRGGEASVRGSSAGDDERRRRRRSSEERRQGGQGTVREARSQQERGRTRAGDADWAVVRPL
jgi:hypothetical protein